MLHLVHLHLVRLQLDLVLQLPLYNYYNYCTQVIGTHLTRRLRPGKEHVVERAPPDIYGHDEPEISTPARAFLKLSGRDG